MNPLPGSHARGFFAASAASAAADATRSPGGCRCWMVLGDGNVSNGIPSTGSNYDWVSSSKIEAIYRLDSIGLEPTMTVDQYYEPYRKK